MARSLAQASRPQVQHLEADETRELFSALYEDLCSLAAHRLAHNRLGRTLEAEALVHEVYLRFAQKKVLRWENRRHFLATASRAMRQVLIERTRRRNSLRRGGDLELWPLVESQVVDDSSEPEVLVSMKEALEKLAAVDALKAELVRLRFFGGFTEAEVGRTLGLAERTVKWHWAFAKAWLRQEIGRAH